MSKTEKEEQVTHHAQVIKRTPTPTTLARALSATPITSERQEYLYKLSTSVGKRRIQAFSDYIDGATARVQKATSRNVTKDSLLTAVKYITSLGNTEKLYFRRPEFIGTRSGVAHSSVIDSVLWGYFVLEHVDTSFLDEDRTPSFVTLRVSTRGLYNNVLDKQGNCSLFVSDFSNFRKKLREALQLLSFCKYAWVHAAAKESSFADEEALVLDDIDYTSAGVDYFHLMFLENSFSSLDGKEEVLELTLSIQMQELWRRRNGTIFSPLLEISNSTARVFAHTYYMQLKKGQVIEVDEQGIASLCALCEFPSNCNFLDRVNKLLISINKAWNTAFKLRTITKKLRQEKGPFNRHSRYVLSPSPKQRIPNENTSRMLHLCEPNKT